MSLRTTVSLAALSVCALALSCGDAPSFQRVVATSTTHAVRPDTTLALGHRWLAYLADESTSGPAAGGIDLNADGDQLDTVAVAVDMPTKTETPLGVAARSAIWNGSELYLVVNELADGKNWEPVDSGDKLVLLHWSSASGALAWVDNVSRQAGRVPILTSGTLTFYVAEASGTLARETNLRVLRSTSPKSPIAVASNDATGALAARLVATEEGLVFAALDEALSARDLNADGDTLDEILALLDGTGSFDAQGYTEPLRSTELALASTVRPRARGRAPHDWTVAFLVSEAAQGATNLNAPESFPPQWRPVQCLDTIGDVDANDDVLFAISYAPWCADPALNPPFDTGLAGVRAIEIAGSAVAVIAFEGADGSCDLNDDGDVLDVVVRWMDLAFPFFPLASPDLLLAIEDVPGGTHGLAELDGRFVIAVDEAADRRDHDGDGLATRTLLAWIEPRLPPFWTVDLPFPGGWIFEHDTRSTVPNVGVSWLAKCGQDPRLGVGFEEEVAGRSFNSPGIGGNDTDMQDSMASFASFSPDGTALVFERVPVALDSDNGGISIGVDIGFFRASEAEDTRDWNGDGDQLDFVLLRTPLAVPSATKAVSTLNALDGSAIAVCETEAPAGAAFIADEAAEGATGTDFNGDGDALDLVVRYFRF